MLTLYEYQKDYLREAKPNWIYDCDCGTGKTIMALAHYRIHFKDKPICIIAPASKIKEGGWQRTFKIMCPTLNLKILSYNVISKHVDNLKDHFIIYDECQKIKNSSGVWGKAAFNICKKSAGFILLSATPLPNSWADAINYFKIFKLSKSKKEFLKRFAITSMQWGYQEIIGWRNLKPLKREWDSISKRLNKSDCLDLPEIVYEDIYFKSSKNYKTLKKHRVLYGIVYDSAMKLRHGLRQHCSQFEKVQYLIEFLESITQNVVIFYNYQSEFNLLSKFVENKVCYACNGQIKDFPTENFDSIKNSVTFANYKSGSEGVEFTYADIIIFFSPTESYTEYYQALGRCHRLGQENKVTVYKYIAKNTIEEDIYNALDSKKDFNYELWEAENVK